MGPRVDKALIWHPGPMTVPFSPSTGDGLHAPASAPDRPRMSRHRGWTAQDDEDLLHLADSRFEIESIAWALDRTPGTIRARLTFLQRNAPVVRPDPGSVADEDVLDASTAAVEAGT